MVPYIDLHCDTLEKMYIHDGKNMTTRDMEHLDFTMFDFSRMEQSGSMAQFLSIYMLFDHIRTMFPGVVIPEDKEYINLLHTTLVNNLERHKDKICIAKNIMELENNLENNKMSIFLTLEGGRAIDNKLENVKKLYDMDVRLVSLTWNHSNCLGYPNSSDMDIMSRGLTDFGKNAVEYMQSLGMLVDVSHLSDGGFYDVCKLSKGPFIASHSDCRAVSRHPRNLTDDMIRCLANKGGVMGINFAPTLLNYGSTEKRSRMEDIIAHTLYAIKVGGEDIVAIGSDFDGIGGQLDIKDISEMQKLFTELKKRGVTSTQIDKMAYKNVKRIISDTLL